MLYGSISFDESFSKLIVFGFQFTGFLHPVHEKRFITSEMTPYLETLSFAHALLYFTSAINNLKLLKYLDVSGSFCIPKDFEETWRNNRLQVVKLASNQIMSVDGMNFD